MGDTTSDFFSVSKGETDVFVMEVDAHGNIPQTTEVTGTDYSASSLLVKLSSPVKVNGKSDVSDGGITGNNNNSYSDNKNQNTSGNNSVDTTKPLDKPTGADATGEVATVQTNSADSSPSSERGHLFFLLISISLVVVVASSGIYFILSKKAKEKESTERALVFSYLQNFDLEDIDVKQAATGGWHCAYTNSLVDGVNVRDRDGQDVYDDINEGYDRDDIDEQTAKRLCNMNHSSLVKDILFDDRNINVDNEELDDQNSHDDSDEDDDGRNIRPWGKEIV